jgi:hypothetical protein
LQSFAITVTDGVDCFESHRGTWGTRLYQHFKGAALDFFGVAGVDVVPCGQNQGAVGEHLGLPCMREAEVDDRNRHGAAS